MRIDLIGCGTRVFRPGILGLSANIKVRSIVNRVLGHTRMFCFLNHKVENLYLSSAD